MTCQLSFLAKYTAAVGTSRLLLDTPPLGHTTFKNVFSLCIHSFTHCERYTLRIDKCLVVRALCNSSPHIASLPSRLQQEVRRCLDVRSGTVFVGIGASRWVASALLSGLFFRGVQKSPLWLRIFFVFSDIQNTSHDIIEAHSFHQHVNSSILTFGKFDLLKPPILIRPFRPFMADSDELRSEHVAGV
jgi:hypothetical protein